MTDSIKALKERLKANKSEEDQILSELQTAFYSVFADWPDLRSAISALESGGDYMFDDCGDMVRFVRASFVDRIDASDRQYLVEYISDFGMFFIDDCLCCHEGEYIIIIQDADDRRDRGVYNERGRMLFPESEYTDGDGEIDVQLRNRMIESYMERNGSYPSVFWLTRYDDIFVVNTTERGEV